jgi:competence protein ComEC
MIANHKGEIPFVVLIIPFLLGIGFGLNLLAGANVTVLGICFIAISIGFVALNLTYTRFKLYKIRWIGGSAMFVILFLAGWISAITCNELNNKNHFANFKARYFVVKISNEPILKNGLLRFTAMVEQTINQNEKTNTSGTLLIAIKDTAAKNLYYGDELLIRAKYNPIDPPFNPAEFNYKKYLANQNIYYQSFLAPKQYVVLATNSGNPVIGYSLKLRQRLIEKFKRNMHDTAAIAVASTLILGYKADLSDEVMQAYSKTGTIHVLSVSGAHVAIIYVLLAFVLGFLDKYRYGRLIKAVLIITLIWYYSLLSGFSPTVCRAAVMISMIIIGKTYSRYINTLNVLAISAFALLLYNPLFIADVGFQLSYLAVCGLLIFQPIIYKWFAFKNNWADKLWALCSVSIAAQVITFPLSAFYFHQFPVYFLFSNLFIIIPTAVIMYAGIIYLALPQIPYVSKFAALVLEKCILLMNKGLTIIENLPWASYGKIWLTIPEYLLLYIIIISLFYFMYDKKGWLIQLALTCTLLFCASISYKTIKASNTDNIVWLNLKKRTGIVFKKGNEAIVVSDLSPTDKNYKYSVQPYLDSAQVDKVTLVTTDKDVKTAWFVKRGNLLQFLNQKVYLLSRQLASIAVMPKVKADYIYITGSAHIALTTINNNFDYNLMLLAGSNSDRFISRITQAADSLHLKYAVLKRNKSFISYSNSQLKK